MIELQFYLIPYFSAFQYERCRLNLVARWTAFVRPLTLSLRSSAFNWPLDSLEALYIIDLFKKLFVTGYFDADGKLECNWRKIAARTLTTLNFW
jgi:hypothetical protein